RVIARLLAGVPAGAAVVHVVGQDGLVRQRAVAVRVHEAAVDRARRREHRADALHRAVHARGRAGLARRGRARGRRRRRVAGSAGLRRRQVVVDGAVAVVVDAVARLRLRIDVADADLLPALALVRALAAGERRALAAEEARAGVHRVVVD